MSQETRRIVAILFSDIVGYTAAMGRDEDLAIRVVSRSRSVQKELVKKFRGEWLQEIGDGALCTFESAVAAVSCALEIQRAFHGDPEFQLRIGIHVGDVVFRETETGHDVFGDGVNVAARVQGVAESGGICISERVYDDLRNRKGIEVRFLGEKQLKNVNRPIRVYAVIDREGLGAQAPGPPAEEAAPWRRRLLVGLLATAALAAAAALYLKLGPRELPPGSDLPATVVSEAPVTPTEAFDAARAALLGAAGPWTNAGARVWTEPSPVRDNATYRVHFEAQCDCAALLFAIDGTRDEITLLFPNLFEPARRLAPGEVFEIPSSPAYQLRAVGGEGLDIIKLLVVPGGFDFPPPAARSWRATPEEPERVAELTGLLERLDGEKWASAVTPLQIAR